MRTATANRRGITLMEVLISIGILSIGLASVVSLIPAGGAAMKASLVDDTKASLAASALADAINRGGLDRTKWSLAPPPQAVVFDGYFDAGVHPSGMSYAVLNNANAVADSPEANRVFRGTDDLAYDTPADENLLPVPFLSATPTADVSSDGRFSWLATVYPHVLPGGGVSPDRNDLAIVTFYQRPPSSDPAGAPVELSSPAPTPDRFEFSIAAPLSFTDLGTWISRGSPILLRDGTTSPPSPPKFCWRTVIMVSKDVTTGTAVLTYDRPSPFPASLAYIYQGAVGVTERIVTLEENSSWGF